MSRISWTDETWNVAVGCTKVSDGCKNCYAERMAVRLANILHPSTSQYSFGGVLTDFVSDKKAGWSGRIKLVESILDKPLQWKKPRKIFVCSMGDLFHKSVPFEFIDKVFAVMALCPQHTFQVLTKRPEQAMRWFFNHHCKTGSEDAAMAMTGNDHLFWKDWPPKNVQIGTSISNQKDADKNIPILLQIPAAYKFLSVEPMLGPVNLTTKFGDGKGYNPAACIYSDNQNDIDKVISGAESKGSHPGRECKIEWIRDLVRQCKDAVVKVFVKQIHIDGKLVKDINQFPHDLRVRED